MVRRLAGSIAFAAALSTGFWPTAPSQAAQPHRSGEIDALLADLSRIAIATAADARSNAKLAESEVGDFQTQAARVLLRASGCGAAATFAKTRPEILGTGIEAMIGDSLRSGRHDCAPALASMLADRWDDPRYVPEGRIALRFKAGAYLDAAADPRGQPLMRAAEAELVRRRQAATLWNARFAILAAYRHAPAREAPYLSQLAALLAEDREVPDSIRKGLLFLFATKGRCDLIRTAGGESLPQGKCPVPSSEESPEAATRAACAELERPLQGGVRTLTVDAAGIATAKAQDPWRRLVSLMRLADRLQLARDCPSSAMTPKDSR